MKWIRHYGAFILVGETDNTQVNMCQLSEELNTKKEVGQGYKYMIFISVILVCPETSVRSSGYNKGYIIVKIQ